LPDKLNPVGKGGLIVNGGAFALIVPEAAEIVTLPCFNVVTNPLPSTVASVGSEVVQVSPVSGLELPSENVPVALNCSNSPAATDEDGDVTVIDCRLGGGSGGDVKVEPPPPQPASRTTIESIVKLI
jgi:hypothetical protein